MKGTWKILRKEMNKEAKQSDIETIFVDNEEINDKQEISERFHDHFATIGEKLAKDIPQSSKSSMEYLSKINKNENKFKFKMLKPTEIYTILGRLKNGKATGLHLMSNSVLKAVKDIIAPSLTDLFNASIKAKIFPDDFKIARVTPIFKNGDTDNLGNYRPISILGSIARVFEKLLYKQLYDFLIENKVLSTQQWGFLSLHSTALALIDCSSNWLLNVDRGENNLTVFLDIKKAFDTIDHNILLRKLDYYGISKEELPFLKSSLSERRQCCNITGYKSFFRSIKCGVPLGSILGPLLLIIYMNDLPNCIEHGHVTMYADDTSASNSLKSRCDIEENVIPSMINICDWLKANKLSLNTTKTDFMLIGSTHNNTKFDNLLAIRVGNELIRRTHANKYLGLIVDDTLKWDLHIDYISKKIKKNIGVMKHVKSCIPKESLEMLYKTLVEPYLRYCNTTWGKCAQQLICKLQTLQNRAARVVNMRRQAMIFYSHLWDG